MDLLAKVREKGVVFSPDRIFSVEAWDRSGMRLGFSNLTEDQIRQGIRIIGEHMKALV